MIVPSTGTRAARAPTLRATSPQDSPARVTVPGDVVRPQLRALTTLRFFACFAVFLHHCVDFTSIPGASRSRFAAFLWEGWSGVSFFFVLSGFILAFTYGDRLAVAAPGAVRSFYVARIARVYPLYVLVFAIAAFAVIGQWARVGTAGIAAAVSQLALLQAFLPVADPFHHSQLVAFAFDGPAWSLSCEAFFYLSFPFLLRFLVRQSGVALALTAVGACCFSLLLAIQLRGSPAAFWLLYVFPPVRLAEFVVGICLGLVFLRGRDRLRAARVSWTALEAATLGLLVVAVACSPAIPAELSLAAYYLPFFALVILVFAVERGRISRAVRAPWLVFLGEISFAFYLLHVLVLRAASALGMFTDGLPSIVTLTAVTGLALAASALVYVRYERPLRSRTRVWLMPG
jgi:peptidoglycan/LPS O-acetylase OafA/YrhL